jgi:tetratricopeptide (TPR) repeat protein
MVRRLILVLILVSLTAGFAPLGPVEQEATAFLNKGNTYMPLGDYVIEADLDKAIAEYNKAIQLKPDYAEAYLCRGDAYFTKGYSDRVYYDKAIADYDRVIQLKPDTAEAYQNRGYAYFEKGDYERGLADYSRVIQLRPDVAEAYFNRGQRLKGQGKKTEAIADYEKSLELTSDPGMRNAAEQELRVLGAR